MTITAGYEFTWAARQFGEREAVVFQGQRLSFVEVNRRANRLANALIELGLNSDHRIAVLLNNCFESLDTVIGAEKAGVTYVALNARHTAAEQHKILKDADPTVVIGGLEFEGILSEAVIGIDGIKAVYGLGWRHGDAEDYFGLVAGSSDEEPEVLVEPSDLMRIHYTSGTTGSPKGITISYQRYYDRQNNFFTALEYGLDIGDSIIHVGPLTHAAGNYLIPYFIRGARNIIMPSFNPLEMQAIIERERVTSLLLVPTMLIRLLDELDRERFDLSSIKHINYGMAPMPVEVLRRGIEAFGPIFREHYGLSECPQPATLLYPHEHVLEGSEEAVRRLASCGRPTLNINIEIRNADGVAAPSGEVGEICIEAKGAANVGYWRSPGQYEENVRQGWFHSGDLGWMDDEGYLFIVGRSKDMIISGGFNVYSREVEEALFAQADIKETAVIGLPDAEWGEIVCAFVVRQPGSELDASTVIDHCRDLIAGYKKPRVVEFIETLPRNNSGKVDKAELQLIFRERHGIKSPGSGGFVSARY
ncbi:MAG TPA: AMP-dependent synthetase [Rhodospirillales bacterium]|nr:AMP-dependent synthetase [Rhodospirillales bacterium]